MGQDGIQDIGDEAASIYNKQVLLSLNDSMNPDIQSFVIHLTFGL
jgi:hypothetical protein